MPRWAEMTILSITAFAIVGGIMVYAKHSSKVQMTSDRERQEGQRVSVTPAKHGSSSKEAASTSPSRTDVPASPLSLEELDQMAHVAMRHSLVSPTGRMGGAEADAPSSDSSPEDAPANGESEDGVLFVDVGMEDESGEELAEGETALPERTEPEPLNEVVAPESEEPVDAAEVDAAEVDGAEVAESEPADEEETEEPPSQPQSASDIAVGSTEELQLLSEAERTLKRLYFLRLHRDSSPAALQRETARLGQILDKLPPESRQSVQALLDRGYNRATGDAANEERAKTTSTQARALDESTVGNIDDLPGDVQALGSRIDRLSTQLGVRRPSVPVRASVNPRGLPSLNTSTGSSAVGASTALPSVQAGSL